FPPLPVALTPTDYRSLYIIFWSITLLSFFFNHTATTETYTLSLHDALPIYRRRDQRVDVDHHERAVADRLRVERQVMADVAGRRSEEHTSELQSRSDLVCRLLLEKKKRT